MGRGRLKQFRSLLASTPASNAAKNFLRHERERAMNRKQQQQSRNRRRGSRSVIQCTGTHPALSHCSSLAVRQVSVPPQGPELVQCPAPKKPRGRPRGPASVLHGQHMGQGGSDIGVQCARATSSIYRTGAGVPESAGTGGRHHQQPAPVSHPCPEAFPSIAGVEEVQPGMAPRHSQGGPPTEDAPLPAPLTVPCDRRAPVPARGQPTIAVVRRPDRKSVV